MISALVALVVGLVVSGADPSSTTKLETLRVNGVDVDVFTPSGAVNGDVLVLPGWDSTRTDWCKNGGLCDEAEKRGLRLVMPEMGKSVYAARVYPETTAAFRAPPTRTQLVDAIKHLQRERGLLANPSSTYAIGRSTGGRGAVLLALDHPAWFRAVASLSGDFDQTQTPKDGLMIGAYGSLEKFPARWRGEDNPGLRKHALRVPVYLGHGAKDALVPPAQTIAFAEHIKGVAGEAHIDADGAHDHKYWRREVPKIFAWFATTPDPVPLAEAAFAELLTYAGTWDVVEDGQPSSADFTVDVKQHVLVQRSGFLAVFARDGASITCHIFSDDGWDETLRAARPNGRDLWFVADDVEDLAALPVQGLKMGLNHDVMRQGWSFKNMNPVVIDFARAKSSTGH